MKLTSIFILFLAMNVSAEGFGQNKVNLRLKKTAISSALSEIESQTNYRFLYNQAISGVKQKISITVEDADLKDVLDKLFNNTSLTYQFMENNLVVIKEDETAKKNAFIPITGRVVDEAGAGLAGVSVYVKGTTSGTTTNSNGDFSIDADANGTLVFSYIGFETQEIPVANSSTINVTLRPAQTTMEQVVVVGYGTSRKRDVTGSTASVKGAELVKQPVLTATQAIQGKVAGVQIIASGAPGSSPIVRIRGTGTMLAGADPLFVVDGVITTDISNINTADIVTVDVLKDASSAAIYGVRGANGVIIITTKKGQSGKMSVGYNGNVGIRQPSNMVEMAKSAQYAAYRSEATGTVIAASPTTTDWYDEILRTAFQQNHNVSLSGGGEKNTFYISMGYLDDEGIVKNSDYQRFNIRANNEFRISTKWKAGILASFANGVAQDVNLGSAFTNAYRANPGVPGKQGNLYGNTSAAGNVGNPLIDIEMNDNRYTDNRLQGTGYLEFKPITALTLRSSVGGDLDNNHRRVYDYQFDNSANTFIVAGGNQRRDHSLLQVTQNRSFRWLFENTATYTKRSGDHNFTALAGITAEKFEGENTFGSKRDVPGDPDLWYLGGSGDPNQIGVNGGGDAWARTSYLGRVNYAFQDRYLLTATFRADGSSRFAEANRWAYSPSFGLGWVIAEESFMQDQDIFSALKLRASWGKTGNDAIPSDAFIITVGTGLPYFFDNDVVLGSYIASVKDPNLKWEITEELDIGLEFGLMNGRLTGEFDYYNKKTNDALVNIQVPVTVSENGLLITNAASFQNSGVELSLRWNGTQNKDFSYYIGGNITFNENKILELNGGQALLSGGVGQQGYTTRSDNGQAIGSFHVLQVIGIYRDQADVESYVDKNGDIITVGGNIPRPGDFKYADIDGDGNIDLTLDRVYAGSYQPKTYFGINAGATWKNVDFSIDCYGNTGNKIYNGKKAFRYEATDNIEAATAANRWQPHDPSSTEPRATTGYWPASTYFVESGDFFRINNITVGYTLPKSTLDRAKITSLRIYLTGQNVWTGKKYTGFTPELPGGPLNSGIELTPYPTTRTFAFGVNLGF